MKTKFIIILNLIILINTAYLFSQKNFCTLKVEIINLKNNFGEIDLQLTDNSGKIIKGEISGILKNRCEIVIDSLISGTYSIRYFHDENSNKKLDTNWLRLPSEGYGFSNNASASFGTPPIEERLFVLNGDLKIELKPKY